MELKLRSENGKKFVQIEDDDDSVVFFNNIHNKIETDTYIKAGIKPGKMKNFFQVNI